MSVSGNAKLLEASWNMLWRNSVAYVFLLLSKVTHFCPFLKFDLNGRINIFKCSIERQCI